MGSRALPELNGPWLANILGVGFSGGHCGLATNPPLLT